MLRVFFFLLAVATCLVGGGWLVAADSPSAQPSVRQFRVADYGAKGDGATDDSAAIRAAIAAAIKAGPGATVLFEAKCYRVSAQSKDGKGACFNIWKASGLTIQGVIGKTELISTSPLAGMFWFQDCKNVCLRGVTIDYDPLPFTQGEIVAVDVKQGTFDLKIDDGYPLLDSPPCVAESAKKWGIVIDRKTRRFKPGTRSVADFNSITPLGNRTWRMQSNQAVVKTMAPGDAFAMRRSMNSGAAVGFAVCDGGVIEDVTEYAAASCCNGFIECEGDIVMRRVAVKIRPGSTRLLSGNADGVHCQRTRKGLLMENCHFEGMTDDGMNTYDRVRMVTEVISPTELRVHEAFDTRPGDRIQVMDPHSGLVRGEATVVSVADRQRIKFDKPIEGVRTTSGELTGIVTPHQRDADVVFNLSTCGSGYIVRNNYFGNFRGRGLLLRGINGLIENNVFEYTSGPGIVIANEPQWPEGPVPRNVVIRGNRFNHLATDSSSCFSGAIEISAVGLKGHAPSGVENIRIENNVIANPPAIGIRLHSCEGAQIVGNRIEADSSRVLPSSIGIRLVDSTGVKVEGLRLCYRRPQTICGIEVQPSVAAGEAGFTMCGVDAQLGSGVPTVLDRRTHKK